jgi:hypothetical protein
VYFSTVNCVLILVIVLSYKIGGLVWQDSNLGSTNLESGSREFVTILTRARYLSLS